MYKEIIELLRQNGGQPYTSLDRIADPVQRQTMERLKNKMAANANTFKDLVEQALHRIPGTTLRVDAPRGVRYLDGTGVRFRTYLWVQLKDLRRTDSSVSISVFATSDFFRVTTEFADDRVTEVEKRNYNKLFDAELPEGAFGYFYPRNGVECTYDDVLRNRDNDKYQISRCIQEDEIQSDENIIAMLAESIQFLTPIYQSIFNGVIAAPENIPRGVAEGEAEHRFQNEQRTVMTQKILFGAPGTGKSFKINDANGYGLCNIAEEFKFRTTFHPDYDYAQFVGAYKPTMNGDCVAYTFVPQVFAKAYVKAWKECLAAYVENEGQARLDEDVDVKNVFLIIEEINRGNCAQIFGDIFQLLDRDKKGFSQYPIEVDTDFATYIENRLDDDEKRKYKMVVGEGKAKLPKNLIILATMNTSDQSLFPMDSAFKRRFDWEYVPINYSHPDAGFNVVGDGLSFKWLNFLRKINTDIYKASESEDKQMGEFFIKPKNGADITLDEFRSKVLFYLWDSVYKDDVSLNKFFHITYPGANGSAVTFQKLFENDGEFPRILRAMLARLDSVYADTPKILPDAEADVPPAGQDEA